MRMTVLLAIASSLVSLAQADSTQALRQMIDASSQSGIPVQLEKTVYGITSQITLKSGVKIQGNGATIRAMAPADQAFAGGVFAVEPDARNVALENLRIEAVNCSFAVQVTSATNLSISDCELVGPVPKSHLLDLNGKITRTSITRSRFENALHLIRLRGDVRGTTIRDCEFVDWIDYATYLVPDGELGPDDTLVENCDYHDPQVGLGGARQMIVAYPSKEKTVAVRNVRIVNNDCVGTGEHYDRTSKTSRGSADQISLHYVDGIMLTGNRSMKGGENGIVVTNFCRNVLISANEASWNNGHGIQVSSLGERTTDVSVMNNYCHNNGCRAGGKAAIAARAYAGIYIHDADRVAIAGNRVTDTRSKWLQEYGILISSSKNIDLGPNSIHFADPAGTHSIALFESALANPADLYNPGGATPAMPKKDRAKAKR